MKYIKEFKDIDWEDWDDEEDDPNVKFNVGDIVRLKSVTFYERSLDEKDSQSGYEKISDQFYIGINIQHKRPIDRIQLYKGKIVIHFSDRSFWYVSDYWEIVK